MFGVNILGNYAMEITYVGVSYIKLHKAKEFANLDVWLDLYEMEEDKKLFSSVRNWLLYVAK